MFQPLLCCFDCQRSTFESPATSSIGRASTFCGSVCGSDCANPIAHQPRDITAPMLGRNFALPAAGPWPPAPGLVPALPFMEFGAVVRCFLRNGNVMGVALPHTGG